MIKKYPLGFRLKNTESSIHETIGRFTSLFFLLSIFLSWPLWMGPRVFPYVPVIQLDETAVHNLGKAINGLLLAFLLATTIKPVNYIVAGVILCIICSGLLDQMRIQPWVYCYLLFLCGFLLRRKGNGSQSIYMAIIFSVYFFGGLWKLNQHYFQTIHFIEEKAISFTLIKVLHYALPFSEMLLSFTLLIPKTRKCAVIVSFIFHTLILIFLSIRRENWVVVPWNIFLPIMNYLVLWSRSEFSLFEVIRSLHNHPVCLTLAVYICFSPLLFNTKYFDRYLSWGLYTEDNPDLWITIPPDQYSSFKSELKYELEVRNLTGAKILSLNYFALKNVRVPLVSEPRILRYLTDYYCKKSHYSNTLVFSEYERPFEAGKYKSWTCRSTTYDQK